MKKSLCLAAGLLALNLTPVFGQPNMGQACRVPDAPPAPLFSNACKPSNGPPHHRPNRRN